MAGAYAAVVTLMHTIEQIQHHPRPPISLDINQVQSLTQKLTFLQEFLEDYSHGQLAEGLVSRIADAAHAVEDTIESRVVDQIRSRSADVDFEKCLQKVVDGMDVIKREVMKIKETITPTQIPLPTRVRSSSSMGQKIMVGFDDPLAEIMDKLTGQKRKRLIIPIVGMGGIGKTTLARNVYSKCLQYFDVCAWTTISQNFNIREFFIDVLSQVSKVDKEDLGKKSDDDLKETLYRTLFGRRYLIVMDDIWSVEVWDKVKLFLPDCDDRSRVVATTRLLSFASNNVVNCVNLKFLDDDQSWTLFCKVVFGEEVCPCELEEIGKKISKGCRGLPLSICVIGGLLVKSKYEVEYWGHVAANLSSVVNLENDEECSKILDMSYRQLPIHLKPCFLHVGVFPEDEKIRVSTLIELWVVEGFLKPICGKSMEVVAQEYFNELVDRNLILIGELGAAGNIKYCSIHDLLREFCLREAQKERFSSVLMSEPHNLSFPESSHRRVVIPEWQNGERYEDALRSTQLTRSLYYHSYESPRLLNFHLLRICKNGKSNSLWEHRKSLKNMLHLVNLRYFDVAAEYQLRLSASSFYRFWNLSTLIIQHREPLAAFPIWKLPQLRHLRIGKVWLQDPACGNDVDGNDIIMENLQTLSTIINFKCSEEIIKMIPHIKKLRTVYSTYLLDWSTSCNFLNNFEHLCKLQSFMVTLVPNESGLFQNLTFPNSLKKLTIKTFQAEDFLEKIGSIPHLVKLKLIRGFFKREWVTVEGQFRSLRFLILEECYQLKCWITESSHFPRLQRLTLHDLKDLIEIPSDIGDISTLESIHVKRCRDSVVISARKIKEEQEENGNESFQLQLEL